MKQAISSLSRLICTLAALAFVVFVNRSAGNGNGASAEAMRCELDPPRDIAGLEACLRRSPLDVELLLDLGDAHTSMGRPADAQAAYGRAVEIDPRDAEVWLRLAASLRSADDLNGARRAAAVAMTLRPNDPVASRIAAPSASAPQVR